MQSKIFKGLLTILILFLMSVQFALAGNRGVIKTIPAILVESLLLTGISGSAIITDRLPKVC